MESSKLAKSTFRFQFCKGFFFSHMGIDPSLDFQVLSKFSSCQNVILFQTEKCDSKLKFVQTINHHGSDTLKTEEVKTLRHGQQTTLMTSKQDHSSSPFKHPKLQDFNVHSIKFNLEGIDVSKKRQTLVFLFQLLQKLSSDCLKGQNNYLEQFLDHKASYLSYLLNQEVPSTHLTCSGCCLEAA